MFFAVNVDGLRIVMSGVCVRTEEGGTRLCQQQELPVEERTGRRQGLRRGRPQGRVQEYPEAVLPAKVPQAVFTEVRLPQIIGSRNRLRRS